MMTSEQLTVNPEVGSLDACGPINYKIPGIKNIPKDFKVSLLKEAAGGHKELYSSKVRICIYIQVFTDIFFNEKISCMFFCIVRNLHTRKMSKRKNLTVCWAWLN